MAQIAEKSTFDASALRRKIDEFFSALGRGVKAYGAHKSRAGEIAVLNAKTDDQLAAMGLRRDQIAVHVFRDMFYV
ncbi:hypothetical protein [Marivivens sp. JLT3646]|uniref:hypothetical protein n=1 Tax=Marivivens sp. JLT3646 TaxID=1920883 RepID=UPI0007FE8CB4|nr:hypothetical protein [Marivivens sp. JLT3646]APO87312.1 hypothetical protein BSK21_09835 [Marivivens sp. JLT3646]OBR35826.1 hypothetical protein A9199_09085 [Donghicola sp. JL3646]